MPALALAPDEVRKVTAALLQRADRLDRLGNECLARRDHSAWQSYRRGAAEHRLLASRAAALLNAAPVAAEAQS